MNETIWLAGAGLLAGMMNALAGGGSFVSLPALVAAGVPSVSANASSTVALYPGGVASAWVYRDGLKEVGGVPLAPSLATTVVGGLAGALLLLAVTATGIRSPMRLLLEQGWRASTPVIAATLVSFLLALGAALVLV